MVVPGLLGSSVLDSLTRITDRIFVQWLAENRTACLKHHLTNMHSLTSPHYFRECPLERGLFFQAIASPRLVSLLDGLFDAGLHFHNTQLFFNPLEGGREPCWHRDLQYSSIDDAALEAAQADLLALHVRIPLVAETGVELIPGTHMRWDSSLERDVRLERNGHRCAEDLPGAVLIEMVPGDVLVFSAQMLHRGNYRLNASRKALDVCIGRYHPYTAQYLDESVLPTNSEMDGITRDGWYRTARAIAAAEKGP